MEKFETLIAWQKAHMFVIEIYNVIKKFPKEEKFILVPQILRAAISIAANLAEGTKRKTNKDQNHFFVMAEASLEEIKYYLILSGDLKYISQKEKNYLLDIAHEIGRLINGLVRLKS